MSIFSNSTVQLRRDRLQSAWNPYLENNQCILIFSGAPITRPGGLDQTYPFLPHPCHYWVSGRRRAHEVTAYSPEVGWVDFYNPISQSEVIWEGADFEEASDRKKSSELINWLSNNRFKECFCMGEKDPSLEVSIPKGSDESAFKLQSIFDSVRRQKDSDEILLIQKAATIAQSGYKKIKEILRPGISEKEIQIGYESEILRLGATGVPYDTIVGSGYRAAVLHALPTQKKINKEDLVLIDAGVDVDDYCVDITRVFSCSEKTNQQKALYDMVLNAQSEAIKMCKPGTMWNQIHIAAAKNIAKGLKDLSILKVSPDEAVEMEVISVFFPHGVGHLVGLRVRDVGHVQNVQPKKYAGATIRIDLMLEEKHLVTVEPGCYFIKALLEDQGVRTRYKDIINWAEVEKWMSLGGVRIEDDILVTSDHPQNLTDLIEK